MIMFGSRCNKSEEGLSNEIVFQTVQYIILLDNEMMKCCVTISHISPDLLHRYRYDSSL